MARYIVTPVRQTQSTDRCRQNTLVVRPFANLPSKIAELEAKTKALAIPPASPPVNQSKKKEISILRRSDGNSPVGESDRLEIIQMIEFGWDDDQILQMLPHIERGSITAFRAHVTRGTYDQGVLNGVDRRTGR